MIFLISNDTQNYAKNVRIESTLVSDCIAMSIDAKTLHSTVTVMDGCNVVL